MKTTDETLARLEKTQRRAALFVSAFVSDVLEQAIVLQIALPKLSAKNRTLPKLLSHFRTHASEDDLFRAAAETVKQYSRTH